MQTEITYRDLSDMLMVPVFISGRSALHARFVSQEWEEVVSKSDNRVSSSVLSVTTDETGRMKMKETKHSMSLGISSVSLLILLGILDLTAIKVLAKLFSISTR